MHPERQAVQVLDGRFAADTCCWCGKYTNAGIYVRFDPKVLLCKGVHPNEEESA